MQIMLDYYKEIQTYLEAIIQTEEEHIQEAAEAVAQHIEKDRTFFVYGPGGHSNLASQEVFFRAGGLMHANAILDEGTLLSSGALRSMAIERTPGYGKIVMDNYQIGDGDLLILVNAYGINTTVIESAIEAKQRGAKVIGISSVEHAKDTPATHPARHPSKKNLHDIVDIHVDSKVQVGDAVISIEGVEQKVGAVSTFVNAFIMNSITMQTTKLLNAQEVEPPIWKSGNATGGDEWNQQFLGRFQGKMKHL
ncbi:sugar isomerase domain-containing protein [Gracilibacillus timonensis]|uniref:sugar isomerase domain-containing protein n=1 Tax=Gracilibacillus timonensis TaxID=1816696 RepID=UPI000824D475|nr:SIS domain-containing protein [Gracilibacillus timonensis]